jgi:hypothetical protein
MFLMFVTFVVTLAGLGVLAWLGFRRIALHLRGNPEGTRAVVEHVLIPLFGRKEELKPEPELEPPYVEEQPDGTLQWIDRPARKEAKAS